MIELAIANGRATATFSRFDLAEYEAFLRVKRLPEKDVVYDWAADAYRVEFPARFAAQVTGDVFATAGTDVALAGHLFDYQEFIVRQAFDARRYAIWADTGLGKTAMELEWARLVGESSGGRVLLLAPTHELIDQTVEEAERFYGREGLPLTRLPRRTDLESWTAGDGHAYGIATYALLAPGEIPSMRRLAGLVADESSILKTGGGTIKWNLIHSAKGIEYKLSCTATPAPNEAMEYASQAAFLEKLRTEGEILWTYFTRDKRGAWSVKPHARQAFYEFMATWSIYLRDPARYGFADILSTLPPPEVHEHRIDMTEEQRAISQELLAHDGRGLFDERLGVRERSKLSQLAKGFLYSGQGPDRAIARVASAKPQLVVDLALAEVEAGRPTIVWTVFDEESEILVELTREQQQFRKVAALHGSMTDDARSDALAAFRAGRADVLVSKASLIGYGLNLQHAKAMVFSGFDDSFERLYQAIRRAYRFGQTETVHVHVPVVPELEGLMLDNLKRKQERFESDVAVQEENYRRALAGQLAGEAAA